MMKKTLLTVLLGLTLAACSTPEPPPAPLTLDFSAMGPLYLTTQDVRIVNRAYSTPNRPPYVGYLFRPRLEEAVNKWGVETLKAVGNVGHATLIIKEANVTQQSLPTEGGLGDMFTRQQASKYIGRVEVSFEAQNPQDRATGLASAEAVHAITLPEDPTEAEKYEAYNALLDALMKDLNRAFRRSVQEKMGRFLTSAPLGGASSAYDASGSYSQGSVSSSSLAAPVSSPAPSQALPLSAPVEKTPLSAPPITTPEPSVPDPVITTDSSSASTSSNAPIVITTP